ncbi:MAG: hypothetical protein U0992_00715 [Planctomycetaceae bacterium]
MRSRDRRSRTTNLATTQGNFAAKFLGSHPVAGGDTDPISVDVGPHSVYEFDCNSAAYELGALLGPDEASSTLMNQQMEAVGSAAAAIARAAEFTIGAQTMLRVTLASAYAAGSANVNAQIG